MTDVGGCKKKDEDKQNRQQSLYIRLTNIQIFRFIGLRPLRRVCLWQEVMKGMRLSACQWG